VPGISPLTVLIAVADPGSRAALRALVHRTPGLELVGVAMDADEAAALTCARRPEAVILDAAMPCGGAPRALRAVSLVSPAPTVLVLSPTGDSSVIPPTQGVEHITAEMQSLSEAVEALGWIACRRAREITPASSGVRVELLEPAARVADHDTAPAQ